MYYYDTNDELFRRFRMLEINYKNIAAEIPHFDQTKVTLKRDEGVWHNKKLIYIKIYFNNYLQIGNG